MYPSPTYSVADIIQRIANVGGFPDLPDNEGLTPLHLASFNGHHVVCATLYRLGAPVNPLDLHEKVCSIHYFFGHIGLSTNSAALHLTSP